MHRLVESLKCVYKLLVEYVLIYNTSTSMGSRAGGAGGAAPPQILEENFSIHSAPQILAGFVMKCFNPIIKFLELRE